MLSDHQEEDEVRSFFEMISFPPSAILCICRVAQWVEHRQTDHEKRGDPNRKHFSLSGWCRRFDSGPCNLINVTCHDLGMPTAIIQFLMVKNNECILYFEGKEKQK